MDLPSTINLQCRPKTDGAAAATSGWGGLQTAVVGHHGSLLVRGLHTDRNGTLLEDSKQIEMARYWSLVVSDSPADYSEFWNERWGGDCRIYSMS
jgi:hypothetical protein